MSSEAPPSGAVHCIALTASVVASANQVSCDLEDEVVILSLETGEYFGLNEVAASVWKLVQESRTVEQLRDALMLAYAGVTREECEAQLLALLAELSALRLVEIG